MQAEEGFYFVGKHVSKVLKQKFRELIGEKVAAPDEVEVVMGRKLQVDLANQPTYIVKVVAYNGVVLHLLGSFGSQRLRLLPFRPPL